jgi:acetoin utilization deacetylase AcuC-like enzyme
LSVALVTNSASETIHDVGGIPEGRDRITAILKGLRSTDRWEKLQHYEAQSTKLEHVLAVHSKPYAEDFQKSARLGFGEIQYSELPETLDHRSVSLAEVYCEGQGFLKTPPASMVLSRIRQHAAGDTPICPTSFDAALLSAGTVITAIDAVVKGGPSRMFCLTRPPGHHAEHDTAMGFCFFNNIAIGAKYLRNQCGAKKVCVVDFDVHHGNGTQHLFYDDPSVLVCNVHRDPESGFYPFFSGHAAEIGREEGVGFNLNIPLPPGSGTARYRDAFDEIAARVSMFAPEWLLVSAGFDAHRLDPLGGMALVESDFAEFGKRLKDLADTHSGGRLISVLEGGYNRAALSACVNSYLDGLA